MEGKFIDGETLARLQGRVGEHHLKLRLGIEQEAEARIFGQGRTFFHPENWRSLARLLGTGLRLSGLQSWARRNARRILLQHNSVVLPHLPAAFEGFRLLHITDPHLDMAEDIPHVLSEAIRNLDYDLCVLTGDYRFRTHGPYMAAIEGLRRLRTHLRGGVYAVLGNHDSLRMAPGMEDLGIGLLLNEHVALERQGARLYLAGIDDPHYYRADNLEKAVAGIPREAVSILLSHTPEIFRQAAHSGFDLMLAGHTHGGQICLPGGIPLTCNAHCPRAFCSGSWRFNGMQGYTSRGSGVSILDARFNCPAEITLHRLTQGSGC
jgi:predicted MPP superfamily phosphohydrolase